MAKQIAQKHTHKLRRHRYSSGNITYFCALPDCSFKITPALAFGKRSICWRCGEEFILSDYAIRLAKPHCENCHKPKTFIPMEIETLHSDDVDILTDAVATVAADSISSLRSRLSQVIHSKAEDEGDI